MMRQARQQTTQLRQKTESQLDHSVPSFVKPLPGENLLHELMHELRVGQVELAMQHEALQQSQIELEKFRDHYDLTLAVYLTLNSEAMIGDINLPGTMLLGVERNKLMHRSFSSFIAPESQDRWNHLFISALNSDHKYHCELTLQKGDGTFTKVILFCQQLHQPDEQMVLHVVLVDMTKNTPLVTTQNAHDLIVIFPAPVIAPVPRCKD